MIAKTKGQEGPRLAEVKREEFGRPAQRPHDAETDQRQVAHVFEVAGVHDSGEHAEIVDQPRPASRARSGGEQTP